MSPPPQDREEDTCQSFPSSQPEQHEALGRIDERLRRTEQGPSFKRRLSRHLQRLPPRYLADHDADDKADDVLLHWGILDECADPDKRPVFHARYIKVAPFRSFSDKKQHLVSIVVSV